MSSWAPSHGEKSNKPKQAVCVKRSGVQEVWGFNQDSSNKMRGTIRSLILTAHIGQVHINNGGITGYKARALSWNLRLKFDTRFLLYDALGYSFLSLDVSSSTKESRVSTVHNLSSAVWVGSLRVHSALITA